MNFNLKIILKGCLVQFLDLIYKTKCIQCGCSISSGILCKTCSKTVQNLPCFAQTFINGYSVFSAFYYEGVIKTLIQELKFRHNKACADYAAWFLYEYIKKIIDEEKENYNFENAIIVPVLTHKDNKNKRGYDNVLEIAKKLSALTNYRVDSEALKKVKYTQPQYKISARERKKNVEGSFELDENFKTDSLVILLDDIVTTGSTLEYITSLFRKNGIQNLLCLTLAKAKNRK